MKQILLLITLIMAGRLVLAEDKIVHFCEDPFPPMVIGEMGKTATGGFTVEIIKAIFNRIDGYEPAFHIMPWTRCLKEIEDKRMDGYMSGVYSPERVYYLTTSDPYFVTSGVWYYLKSQFPNGFEWESYEDFKGYRIGILRGSSYGKEFDNARSRGVFQVLNATTTTMSIQQLLKKRVDFTLDVKASGDHVLHLLGVTDKVSSPRKPLYVNAQRFALGKYSPHYHLLPKINQLIWELKVEGILDELVNAEK